MRVLDFPNYLRGLHNVLISLFFLQSYQRFAAALQKLLSIDRELFGGYPNAESLWHLYSFIHRINLHYLEGSFTEGLKWMDSLSDLLKDNPYRWDAHRLLVFQYKIACLYFGAAKFEIAIDYLNQIINQKNTDYREDIQCFARILSLIAHYELGNMKLVEYQVKNVYRFLLKMDDLQEVQRQILLFIRKMPNIKPAQIKNEFIELKQSLEIIRQDPYEKRPFLYLDIISWLESKINQLPVEYIIKQKFENM